MESSPSTSERRQQTKPTRVIVVGHGPPLRGGISTVVTNIADDPDLNRTFNIEFFNTAQSEANRGKFALENVARVFRDSWQLFRLVRRGNIVHSHSVQDPTFVAWRQVMFAIATRLRGAKMVLHNHAFRIYMEPAGTYSVGIAHRVAYWLLDKLCVANVLLTTAGIPNLRPLMPRIDFPVISNSVRVSDVDPARPGAQPPTLIVVGEIIEQKGISTLVAALDQLKSTGVADWNLEIIGNNEPGTDPDRDRMLSLIEKSGLASSMTGPLPKEEVLKHLSAADIFVFPTKVEGQPFALMEAMSAGLAIIASDIPTIAAMVTDEETGVLVPVDDAAALSEALRQLIEDPQRRVALGQASREVATERYDHPVFVAEITRLYTMYGG